MTTPLASALSAPTHGSGSSDTTWRPADLDAIHEWLTLLARAIRQLHTYPPTSPLCLEAIAACQRGIQTLGARDPLVLRVTPAALMVDDTAIGTGTIIETELARRLHRARAATVEIGRQVSARDLSRLCESLSRFGESVRNPHTLAHVLDGHGVSGITVRVAHDPEVVAVGEPTETVLRLVDHERERRQTQIARSGPAHHLYPPDRGWVRLDPAMRAESLSLADLAVLLGSPSDLASVLTRLTGDEGTGPIDAQAALEQKFGDLTTIFASLDPQLSRLFFARLSQAVLDLDSTRRASVLRQSVLPGLLDGRLDGTILQDFPDVDLADALCLLLDLETAAPELLATALDRLNLPSERRAAVVPLLEERLHARAARGHEASRHDRAIEGHARRLIRLGGEAKSFAEYAAFDLSLDAHTREAVTDVRGALASTDVVATELETLYRLVGLEPNPTPVERLLSKVLGLLDELERAKRWESLWHWASRFRALTRAVGDSRPDVADAVDRQLRRFCTPSRAMTIATLSRSGDEALARQYVAAFGGLFAQTFLERLGDSTTHAAARPLVGLMVEHAQEFAPHLASRLRDVGPQVQAAIVKVLGAAGPAYVPPVVEVLAAADETLRREALRALTRMGGTQAATAVAAQLSGSDAWSRSAEEALWHFPVALAHGHAKALLTRTDFVGLHPQVAGRLLDRLVGAGASALEPILERVAALRFRFWNPALVRVAMKARRLLRA